MKQFGFRPSGNILFLKAMISDVVKGYVCKHSDANEKTLFSITLYFSGSVLACNKIVFI